jgi:hypothetical protein
MVKHVKEPPNGEKECLKVSYGNHMSLGHHVKSEVVRL